MTKPDTGVEAEMEAFADELSDEAFDRRYRQATAPTP
jgi:hypothetical protein